MNITDVRTTKFEKGNLLGFADVTFDNYLHLTGLKIFRSKDGNKLNVLPPSTQSKKIDEETGKLKWYDVYYFDMRNEEGKETYWKMVDAVRNEWNKGTTQTRRQDAPPKSSEQSMPEFDDSDIPF